MSDYIDRQAAIDAICKHGTELERRGITVLTVVNHKQVTVDLLENLPSAEVVPVKHGRWYRPEGWPKKTYKRKCTHCQGVAYFCGNGDYLYCPNCGAKMDEGIEEE